MDVRGRVREGPTHRKPKDTHGDVGPVAVLVSRFPHVRHGVIKQKFQGEEQDVKEPAETGRGQSHKVLWPHRIPAMQPCA